MSTLTLPPTEREAVAVREATAISGLGRTRLYAAIGSGELPSIKIGRRRLILVATLRAWLKSLEQHTNVKV